jgi:hypothetical protein
LPSGSQSAKISLSENRNMCLFPSVSSWQEGRFARIVTIRGAGCGGRDSAGRSLRSTIGNVADGQVVWSWHPWAGAKSRRAIPATTVTNKVMDTGEQLY